MPNNFKAYHFNGDMLEAIEDAEKVAIEINGGIVNFQIFIVAVLSKWNEISSFSEAFEVAEKINALSLKVYGSLRNDVINTNNVFDEITFSICKTLRDLYEKDQVGFVETLEVVQSYSFEGGAPKYTPSREKQRFLKIQDFLRDAELLEPNEDTKLTDNVPNDSTVYANLQGSVRATVSATGQITRPRGNVEISYGSKKEATEALSEVFEVIRENAHISGSNSISLEIDKFDAILSALEKSDENDDKTQKQLAKNILMLVLSFLGKTTSRSIHLALSALTVIAMNVYAGAGDVLMGTSFALSLTAMTNPKALESTINKFLAQDNE